MILLDFFIWHTLCICLCITSNAMDDANKGRQKMFGTNFHRHLIAGFAAIAMSVITIGATVAPTDAVASPIQASVYA